jgi:hypothetical protein
MGRWVARRAVTEWVWVRSQLRPWWVVRVTLASWMEWKRGNGRTDRDWEIDVESKAVVE